MDPTDLREIAHDQWVPFLSEFSKAHSGEPVEVRVIGRDGGGGATTPAAVNPLMAIAGGTDPAVGEHIAVVTGPARPVSYDVAHPVHVRVARRADGRPLVVQIEGRDGATTVVRFLLDGQPPLADA